MNNKNKIAILGGGVSAMTAACYLTEKSDWQTKYDITVYQMGWRLGGKGASGRNAEYGQRIEEHGLHVWFGAYVNSFKTMQKVYTDLNRPADMPLATFDEAFKPHSFIALQEFIKDNWETWGLEFPTIPGNPADGDLDPSFWDLIQLIYYWLKEFSGQLITVRKKHVSTLKSKEKVKPKKKHDSWWSHIVHEVQEEVDDLKEEIEEWGDDIQSAYRTISSFVGKVTHHDRKIDDPDTIKQHTKHQHALSGFIEWIKEWLEEEFEELLDDNDEIRRLFIGADLAITSIKGIIADDVYHNGFGYLNQWDFKEWLTLHGANEKYTVNSAPIRGFYDLVFGYEGGDFSKPNLEAGVSLLAMLRIALCYKGGIMWKMQAGMGDVIFSPIYELLKKRGVKFEYFHKVDELIPNLAGTKIEKIRVTKQVDLKQKEYQPFVNVDGLPCWPSTPNYNEIVDEQAQLLQSHNINLESMWTDWPNVYEKHFHRPLPQKTLTLGNDFDTVIFGISVGGLDHICPQLLTLDAKLQACSQHIKTVATQAFQVWTDIDYSDLGFDYIPENNEQPILSGFVEPYDTWAAMNQLLCREAWPAGIKPQNVAYFCSAQTITDFPPASDHNFPKETTQQAKDNAISYLKNDVYNLWPKVASKGDFNWAVLTDQSNQQGEERFNSQYWRSNVDPSERYVLSVKNSSQYRLNSNETQFTNFYITGDWINTGVNAGCVEAATMAGMETSRAISGYPENINGEYGFSPYKK
ncbi:NAD(P)-binding protein [Paraglaciecola sp.]|uniref:NAD(P)-binding protein n=1 Tax=Paraglaciecola sp. TaxID=1920173 RepID=UPI003EF2FC48